MVGSKCNLKMHVRNVGYPFPYKSGAQNSFLAIKSQLKGKFNGLYLQHEIRYTQASKCVTNYKGSTTSSQNDVNFGTQTASIWTVVFTNPSQIPHTTSLPGFADGDQQTKLNHTLSNGGR